MQKNTAGKWIVFAFQDEGGANPGDPVTGDAANITANVRIDGAAANAVDDTNPTELEDGYYIFDLTATETNGDLLLLAPTSGTANTQVIGVPGAVWTTPANFPAMGIESDGDLTKCNLVATNTDMRGTDNAALASVVTMAAINAEIIDVLSTDTLAESTGVPAANASAFDKIAWLATMARNKQTQTATTLTVYDDAESSIATSTVSDDGTTLTRGEFA